MITPNNLRALLETLGFKPNADVFTKRYPNNAQICVDFKHKKIAYSPLDHRFKEGDYPSNDDPSTGFIIHRNTTTNFSSNENFVCLVAVHKLLEKGYAPKHIILEPTFKVGHNQQVYGDILVLNQEFNPLVLIENKTYGNEFSKAWNATLKNGDQLFSYYAVHKIPYLCLLTFKDAHTADMRLISMQDNPEHLERLNRDCKQEDKKRGFSDPSNTNAKSYFEVWSQTYSNAFTTKGIFEEDIQAYNIGKTKYSLEDLRAVSADQISSIYHEFATILRHHSIGNYENSFYILVDLFLCKVIDEIKNPNDLQFTYKGVISDNPFLYCDRLLNLYEMGIKELFNKQVINVKKSAIGDLFKEAQRYEGKFKEKLDDIFDQQKYFNIKKFNFIEVENSEEFYLNFKVLVQVAGLIQDLHLSQSQNNQFLGDLFEGFLNRHIHQTEGRFFTPTPITNFIIHSLPPLPNHPKVLDFACGAGHFLTEFMARHKDAKVYGIEKNKDLSKVAKLACIFHNPESASLIIFQDALDHIQQTHSLEFEPESFDYILSNPPYSVKGFLSTLDSSVVKGYRLHHSIEEKSYESNNAIECFFVERALHFLKEGGVFALILPVSVLQKGGIYEKTRALLLENFKLLCIVELNSRTFGSTGTQTIILFAQKAQKYSTDLLDALTKANFEEKKLEKDFNQTELLKEYCAFRGYPYADFKAFMADKNLNPALEQSFSEYFRDFESKEPKTFKKKLPTKGLKQEWFKASSFYAKDPKQESEAQQSAYFESQDYQDELQAWQREQALEQMHALELEKMRLFALIQGEEVLILKSPPDKKSDNKSNKAKIVEFLGYDWSKRKGDEGIKYISAQSTDDPDNQVLSNVQSVKEIQTPLYDPKDNPDPDNPDPDNPDPDNPTKRTKRTKISHAFKNFMQAKLKHASSPDLSPSDLSPYRDPDPAGYQLFSAPLRELIDFSKAVLDKAISLTPKKMREEVTSIYPIVKLGTCGKFLMGGTPSRKNPQYWNGTIKWLTISDYAEYQSITDTKERITEAGLQASNVKLVPKGAVVVSIYATIGRVGILEEEMTTNQAIVSIIPNQDFMSRYLMYVIGYYKFQLLDEVITTSQKNINLSILQNMCIPKPPLEVQEQIITECAQVEKRAQELQEGIQNYQNLILAVLEACGVVQDKAPQIATILETLERLNLELTNPTPIDPKLEELKNLVQNLPSPPVGGWEMVKIAQIANKLSAGGDKPKVFSQVKTPQCQVPVYANAVEAKGLYGYTDKATITQNALTISARGTIGYVVARYEPFYPIVRLIVLIPNEQANLKFLEVLLNNTKIERSGVNIPQLTLPEFSNLKIPLPPLEAQEQIISVLTQIEQEIARLDAEIATLQGQEQEILQEFLGKERERERERSQKLKAILEDLERAKALKRAYLTLLTHALEKAGLKPTLATLLDNLPTPPAQGWDFVKLGDICDFRRGPFGGSLKKEIFVKSGYKVYEQQHAIKNDFEIGNYFITQEKFDSMKSFEVIPNDLIVSCSGTIGKIAIVPSSAKQGIINQALLRLRLKNDKTTSKALKIILGNLNNPFEEKAHGVALKNVANIEVLKQIKIPLPPLQAQEHIVGVVEHLESQIATLQAHMPNLEAQKQAVLEAYLN
ncbi:restriction endonuclease subunit S [Helicobacter vulpis]|uniref:restriction endonuclease subunit S n=1 Tax=Helicobacter vulpis TaxID=2316076 RepID=UPI000EB09936|nr:restriction endonuclease subunit S [Helicobacter vulpis]